MSAMNAKLPLLATIIFTAAMVGTLAWQGYSFWLGEQKRIEVLTKEQSKRLVSRAKNNPTVDLSSLNLFGSSDGVGEPQEVDTENLPETNLRIFLRGVLAADGEYPASALIEDSEGKTDAYVVGNDLPGGAKLRSVHPRRVILDRGGKLENLYFPETDDSSGMSVAVNEINETTAQQYDESTPAASSPTTAPEARSPATSSSSDQRREEIRQRLEQLRERLRNNSN
ncbi:type II secretion system protein N [Marinobacter caseinilyticus]|uniref:type II secretion system protein N n=1 Tax=Marinobacter caseinilyticus TaxID=2692195 RepID=UPI0014099CB4|nr:type II secretion system protein N [Marinobacter caseinilyticus]